MYGDLSICFDECGIALKLDGFSNDTNCLTYSLEHIVGVIPMNFSRRGALIRGVGFSIVLSLIDERVARITVRNEVTTL
jgi:hypothetical protein